MTQRIATYSTHDCTNGQRLHAWGGPPERFAIGNGPIHDITEAEYERLYREDMERRTAASEEKR